MRAQKQLCIVERVKIVDRRARTEPDALDLLQIQKQHILRLGRYAAVFDAGEGLFQRVSELSVEHGRRTAVVYFIITGFGGVVHHFAAVNQQHALILAHMDDGAVADIIRAAAPVGAAAIIFPHCLPAYHDGLIGHTVRFQNL